MTRDLNASEPRLSQRVAQFGLGPCAAMCPIGRTQQQVQYTDGHEVSAPIRDHHRTARSQHTPPFSQSGNRPMQIVQDAARGHDVEDVVGKWEPGSVTLYEPGTSAEAKPGLGQHASCQVQPDEGRAGIAEGEFVKKQTGATACVKNPLLPIGGDVIQREANAATKVARPCAVV